MPTGNGTPKANPFKRDLLLAQFTIYSRIVGRKHGLTVPLTPDEAANLSDEDLMAYVDSLREMAHLPPV
jgi:hypothetical protein